MTRCVIPLAKAMTQFGLGTGRGERKARWIVDALGTARKEISHSEFRRPLRQDFKC